jgi:alpha-tubulin suppressor-like RCC1 family protein
MYSCQPDCYRVIAFALGGNHSCALFEGNTMRCWGYNSSGQLGYGTTFPGLNTKSSEPVDLPDIQLAGTAVEIAGGGFHTCIRYDDLTVQCWGNNWNFQLGYGDSYTATDTLDIEPTDLPRVARGETPLEATALTAGAGHTCATVTGGSVFCWGANVSGQLGDGTTVDRSQPVAVLGLPGSPTSVVAGDNHTCAIASETLYCWGNGDNGQLGRSNLDDPTTAELSDLVDCPVVDVSCGAAHTCVICDDRTVLCFGWGDSGQIGDGLALGDNFSPVEILLGAIRLVTGTTHTCALTGTDVVCWGDNSVGQLGDITASEHVNASEAPTVSIGGGVERLYADRYHTCAFTSADGLRCWGTNGYGQLGYALPQVVGNIDEGVAITVAGDVNLPP